MPSRALVCLLAVLSGSLLGCNVVTKVGSTCAGGECAASTSCKDARQQLPERCTADRSCGRVPVPPDVQACDECNATLERLHIASEIASCACVYCAAQVRGCFASGVSGEHFGDSARDTLCQAVVECGWANHCAGSDCYCGEGVDRDTCLQQANDPDAGARGPCAPVIEAAVGCADAGLPGNCVFANQLQADSVLSRATDIAKCVTGDPLIQGAVIEPRCPLEQIDQLGGR